MEEYQESKAESTPVALGRAFHKWDRNRDVLS